MFVLIYSFHRTTCNAFLFTVTAHSDFNSDRCVVASDDDRRKQRRNNLHSGTDYFKNANGVGKTTDIYYIAVIHFLFKCACVLLYQYSNYIHNSIIINDKLIIVMGVNKSK